MAVQTLPSLPVSGRWQNWFDGTDDGRLGATVTDTVISGIDAGASFYSHPRSYFQRKSETNKQLAPLLRTLNQNFCGDPTALTQVRI